MRQATFIEPARVEWWDVDAPQLKGPGEALVRPLAVSTCDLDTAILAGAAPLPGPFPLGHECVAEVIETGDSNLRAGQLVSVPFQISCGGCDSCRRGRTGDCERVRRLSMYGLGQMGGEWGGFLSDAVRVPFAGAMLVALPDGVDPAAAASVSDNVSDGWRTVAGPLEREPGAPVLVVSDTQSLGLYAAAVAVALGAERVDYLDADAGRLERAAAVGANPVQREGDHPHRLGPFPITVAASADSAALHCALRSTAPGGFCTSAGIFFEPETPLPMLEMYTNGVTLHTGRVHARAAMPAVLDLIASGRLRPELVTGRTVAWDDAATALAEHPEKLVIVR